MIDWSKKRTVAEVDKEQKLSKANRRVLAELPEVLAEFMDAVLANDQPALARLRKYRADVKAWLADPAGPDLSKRPKRNGT